MPLTSDQRRAMMSLEKQKLQVAQGRAHPLTKEQEDWFEAATNALLTGEDVDGLPQIEKPEAAPAPIAKPEAKEAEVVIEATQPHEEDDTEDLVGQIADMREGMLEMAKEQGTYDRIQKAMNEYGEDLYLCLQRGHIIAFRPMYWDEVEELSSKTELEADKWLSERCVVVGLEKLVGKRARAGVYANLARKVMAVSDHQGDMNDVIVPTKY